MKWIDWIYKLISPRKKSGVYRFYKESSNNSANREWYIDLPKYPGPKSALQMVCGADFMLDTLSGGKDEVNLRISLKPDFVTVDSFGFSESLTLAKTEQTTYGRWYEYKYSTPVWLCPVVIYVFGYYPETIYFKVL